MVQFKKHKTIIIILVVLLIINIFLIFYLISYVKNPPNMKNNIDSLEINLSDSLYIDSILSENKRILEKLDTSDSKVREILAQDFNFHSKYNIENITTSINIRTIKDNMNEIYTKVDILYPNRNLRLNVNFLYIFNRDIPIDSIFKYSTLLNYKLGALIYEQIDIHDITPKNVESLISKKIKDPIFMLPLNKKMLRDIKVIRFFLDTL